MKEVQFKMFKLRIFTSHKRSLQRLCFYICLYVHRGEVCIQGGLHLGEDLYPEGLHPGVCI